MSQGTKFCKHCGQIIDSDCVVCPKCGKQVENLNSYGGNGNGPIIINNNNNNNNNNANKTTQPAQTTTNKNTTTTTKPNTTTNTTTNTGNNNTSSTPSSTSDVALFAAILQCEAGGYDGMLAVATVIMNRVASPAYPNNLHDVIYQSGQFAPTWNGSLNKVLKQGASSTAYQVAQDALAGARHSAVINCLQFRSASTGVSGVNVGGNVFF